MNPETTITLQDIKNICRENGIKYQSAKRITDGFTNEVHLINNEIILKVCTRPDNIDNFIIEVKALENDDTIIKPKFITADFSKQVIKQPYILMSYVSGTSLGSLWHTLDHENRQSLIEDIAVNLKKFNAIKPGSFFQKEFQWGDDLINRFEVLSLVLLERNTLNKQQVSDIKTILNRYKTLLNQTPTKVVYWDIHFDNFIVNNDNKLAAIIDLEAVGQTAIEYPLFVVQKMMDNPKQYLSLGNEQYASVADYKDLWNWYEQCYPEMFAVEHLKERVKIYRLLDTLHLLKDWPHTTQLHKDLSRFITELA